MLDIAHALLYLHNLSPSIVHGDLKPGNVFVECREGQMQTKLADFGLARRITVSAATMGGRQQDMWAFVEDAEMELEIYIDVIYKIGVR